MESFYCFKCEYRHKINTNIAHKHWVNGDWENE